VRKDQVVSSRSTLPWTFSLTFRSYSSIRHLLPKPARQVTGMVLRFLPIERSLDPQDAYFKAV
jgi:hypothetical protein